MSKYQIQCLVADFLVVYGFAKASNMTNHIEFA